MVTDRLHLQSATGTILRCKFSVFSTLPAVDGSALTGISAGATGGGSDEIFYENGQTVTTELYYY